MENVMENLISTMESNAKENKADITNVSLWANSWRREYIEMLELLIEETELEEYDAEMKLGSIKCILIQWIKDMEGVKDENQTKLI